MPRTPRLVLPGLWYHITARGIERRPIFRDDRDRARFVQTLAELTERFRLRLHAYVLMENHYHLLLQTPEPNLSRAIQWLNLRHTAWFNRRHQRAGYLFQGRFKSVVVDPVGWALSLSAYIHLNPVRVARLGLSKTDRQRARAGPVANPGRDLIAQRLQLLRHFPWSSYLSYLRGSKAPAWLDVHSVLKLAGGSAARRVPYYREYVENQLRQGLAPSPWENLHQNLILGAEKFVDQLRAQINKPSNVQHKKPRWAKKLRTFEEIVAAVEKERGQPWLNFRDRHADLGRDLVLYMARRATNLTLAQLGARAGLKTPAHVSMAIKRYQARLHTDPKERTRARSLAKTFELEL